MSTRAVYTFKDDLTSCHIYKHHDGYPSGAQGFIQDALAYAWALPRFDPSDFAAAFVAANKSKGGGGVYLSNGWCEHDDLDYRYEIRAEGKELHITAYESQYTNMGNVEYNLIFVGSLAEFVQFAAKNIDANV